MASSAKEEFDAQVVLLCQWSISISMLPLSRLREVIETTSEGPAATFLFALLEAAESVQDVVEDFPELAHAPIPRKQPQPEANRHEVKIKKG